MATINVTSLTAKLGFNVDTSGLDKFQKGIKGATTDIGKLGTGLAKTTKTTLKFGASIFGVTTLLSKLTTSFGKAAFNANIMDSTMFQLANTYQGLNDAMKLVGGSANDIFGSEMQSKVERSKYQIMGVMNTAKLTAASLAGLDYQGFLAGDFSSSELNKRVADKVNSLKKSGQTELAINTQQAFAPQYKAGQEQELSKKMYGVSSSQMGNLFTRLKNNIGDTKGLVKYFADFEGMSKEQQAAQEGTEGYKSAFGGMSDTEKVDMAKNQAAVAVATAQSAVYLQTIAGMMQSLVTKITGHPYLATGAAVGAYGAAKGVSKLLGGTGRKAVKISKEAAKDVLGGGRASKILSSASRAIPTISEAGPIGAAIGVSALAALKIYSDPDTLLKAKTKTLTNHQLGAAFSSFGRGGSSTTNTNNTTDNSTRASGDTTHNNSFNIEVHGSGDNSTPETLQDAIVDALNNSRISSLNRNYGMN